jgi:bifunctional UDP-N-acetylglucosamine pyrophosphorylase/glucosamine-1-phosphate N-acetyltransferase
VGDSVFVGSNSTLVAPLILSDGAFVAAGSVVTNDVSAKELAVGRARQRNIIGWQRPDEKKD